MKKEPKKTQEQLLQFHLEQQDACESAAVEHAWHAGQIFNDQKTALSHGEFDGWCFDNCDKSKRQVSTYMLLNNSLTLNEVIECSSIREAKKRIKGDSNKKRASDLNSDEEPEPKETRPNGPWWNQVSQLIRENENDEPGVEGVIDTLLAIHPKLARKIGPQKTKAGYTTDFEQFWKAFPSGRKNGKLNAFKVWKRSLKMIDALIIIDAAKEYAASDVGQSEYVKGPEPWLNGGCWDDDRAAWKRLENGKLNECVGIRSMRESL